MEEKCNKAREYIRLGWLMVLFAAAVAGILLWQSPGSVPQLEELECVTGVFKELDVVIGTKSKHYDVALRDGGVYDISTIVGFSRSSFEAKVQPGDVIALYLEDGLVCGVYDKDGAAVLSVEDAWKGMRENESVGVCLGGIFAAGGAACLIRGYSMRRHGKKLRADADNAII